MDPVLEGLLARFSELKAQYVQHLAGGSIENYAAYQKACGVVEGLSLAEREVKELGSRMSSEEDKF